MAIKPATPKGTRDFSATEIAKINGISEKLAEQIWYGLR